MARMHGSQVRVYLGSRDVSGDLSTITPSLMADTHESTTFASAGAHEHDPGLLGWEADFNAFYDPSAGGIGRQLETLLGATGGILTIVDGGADAINAQIAGTADIALVMGDSILDKRGQPITVSDLIKLKGHLKATQTGTRSAKAAAYGVLLHSLGAEPTSHRGTSVDNGASSANGGRANLHITAAAGTGGTVKVQHSTDNVTFTDLITFVTASAAGSQTLEVAGTVNQYVAAQYSINSTSSLTFVLAFARY